MMKISDYEILKIEATVLSFFETSGIEAQIIPDMMWRKYESTPFVYQGTKRKDLDYNKNMAYVANCRLYRPNTSDEYYQLHVFITNDINVKIKKHTALRDYMKSMADTIGCKIEVNYSKHSRNYNILAITMHRYED